VFLKCFKNDLFSFVFSVKSKQSIISRDGKAGRAVRAGPWPAGKNMGRTNHFIPLTRISPPRITRSLRGPVAGRAGPLTRKQTKKLIGTGSRASWAT